MLLIVVTDAIPVALADGAEEVASTLVGAAEEAADAMLNWAETMGRALGEGSHNVSAMPTPSAPLYPAPSFVMPANSGQSSSIFSRAWDGIRNLGSSLGF